MVLSIAAPGSVRDCSTMRNVPIALIAVGVATGSGGLALALASLELQQCVLRWNFLGGGLLVSGRSGIVLGATGSIM